MAFNQSIDDLKNSLVTDPVSGLTEAEAKKRLEDKGANALAQEKPTPAIIRFLKQFEDFMIWILMGAAFISFFTHEVADGFIILAIVVLNGVLGFVQENNAEKSMQALKNMQVPKAQVIREGNLKSIPSPDLVVGDLVQLNAGDVIPADGRLVETAALRIEEAQLTGESVPVDKHADVIDASELALGDRHNMAYATSRVTAGRGRMLVTATAMNTEIGKIAGILANEKDEKTPLQQKLHELGKMLGVAAIVICLLIFAIGYLQGKDALEMMMIAIALAVAAVPEGLPAIVTIVLAMGVKRMIGENAIVRQLPAVETLGAASVICSDKTGTLTQNKMTVQEVYTMDKHGVDNIEEPDDHLKMLIKVGILCNDASVNHENGKEVHVGDPTETALLALGLKFNLHEASFDKAKRVAEIPFDSDRKRMSTINGDASGYTAHVKGAPDQLLKVCNKLWTPQGLVDFDDKARGAIEAQISDMSSRAMRVLAFALKAVDQPQGQPQVESLESDLAFVGLMGMIDPPRLEVKAAVAEAKGAGVRTVMITGDYKDTALAIAKDLGILNPDDQALSGSELDALSEEDFVNVVDKVSVYARVSPSHKVRIVKALKAKGQIVAMTGDGVNDAPALKGADIGCAMGITGTDVSKEASDLILTDDNFSTIVAAVKEGRTIYDNIKKAVNFLLTSNSGEIFTLLIAILFGMPTPLLAIHILWINLVTDSFPALALGLEKSEADIMQRKPRDPKVSILGEGMMWDVLLQGMMIGALSLTAFMIGLKDSVEAARSMTFVTLSLAQLAHSYNVRSRHQSLFKLGVFSNKRLNQGVLVSLTAMIGVYLIPFTRDLFKLTALTPQEIGLALGLGLVPIVVMELYKGLRKAKK